MAIPALKALPTPDLLGTSIRLMAPAYLRRRLSLIGTPYRDGDTTTFVYVGDADAVRVSTFMSLFPEIPALKRAEPDSEVWTVTVRLPVRSRVEYKLDVTHAGRSESIVDPLNPDTALDPFGSNSVTYGPEFSVPDWVSGAPLRPDAIAKVDIVSTAFDDTRTVGVYRPPHGEITSATPLLIVHDASDLVTFADLRNTLDGLILGGHVDPFVAAFLDPVHRNREYTASVKHATFVMEDVLPATRKALDVDRLDRVLLAGASLGGVAALSTAWRHPGAISDLILLSGSFVTAQGGPWNRGPMFQPVIAFMRTFTASGVKPADRIWMACGEFEGLAADNRAFVPILRSTGAAVSYREPADGHHWHSWRTSLGEALIDLIGSASGSPA